MAWKEEAMFITGPSGQGKLISSLIRTTLVSLTVNLVPKPFLFGRPSLEPSQNSLAIKTALFCFMKGTTASSTH